MGHRKLTIAIDFDGVIATLAYPKIGKLRNGAKETINRWYKEGHTIIINSCRAGNMQKDMVRFLVSNQILFSHVNANSQHLIDLYGTDCRKISADIYFDDLNAGGFKNWRWAQFELTKLLETKPVIICLIGESGSGKTTWAEYIEAEYGIKMIQSYTDRAKRTPDENGHTFVTVEEFDAFKHEDMIAYTNFGNKRYCCLKDDVRKINTYVIDEDGFIYLSDTFADDYNIYSIRLTCDKGVRIERAGLERTSRDYGKFSLPMEFFDVCIDTSYQKEEVQNFIDLTLDTWL